jgi:uncharacterized protein with NAD-binding domain and iron-sulfur cluster
MKQTPGVQPANDSGGRPLKVAILGGGCASLTTAFELTRPEHRGSFEVHVYQQGWRLGGKGASGRGEADRIEEHGLHLWLGFYENAFRLMRECYTELRRDPAHCHIAHWRDAFTPAPLVSITDRSPTGDWKHWIAHFPPGRGLPGDPLTSENPFTVQGYLSRAALLLIELLRAAQFQPGTPVTREESPWPRPGEPAMPSAESLVETLDRLLRFGQLATAAAVLQAAELLRATLSTLMPLGPAPGGPQEAVLRLLDAISQTAHRHLSRMTGGDDELARVWQVADIVLAILRGALRFGLAYDPRGFDAIDDYDWIEWLRMNGASERSLDSGFVRGIYDLAFAYADGDVKRPALAAGAALRGAMRMFFTYRGSLFWKMSSGMGDIVFAPLYEVLKRRGVKFHFFHKVKNLRLVEQAKLRRGERPYVESIELDVQALTKDGGEYAPLVDVRGLPCWPARPDYAQLRDGERLEREGWAFESHWEERKVDTRHLHAGRDFDAVVLGVSIGALPHVARELIERDGHWRRMVEEVKTVATQALQLWLKPDMAQLGWREPPVNLSGFVEPFDTWADMSHLVPEESWKSPPGALAYFCSVLPDARPEETQAPDFPARQRERVRAHAIDFLNQHLPALWPRAVSQPGHFRWELLHCTADEAASPVSRPTGEERIDTQYLTANVSPTERYVLTVPGSTRFRISPLELSFDNLTIAGDWTASGLNTGCIESAVMSGKLAAHALSGAPRLEDIIGYDHP